MLPAHSKSLGTFHIESFPDLRLVCGTNFFKPSSHACHTNIVALGPWDGCLVWNQGEKIAWRYKSHEIGHVYTTPITPIIEGELVVHV